MAIFVCADFYSTVARYLTILATYKFSKMNSKLKRYKYDESSMQAAIESVRGGMSKKAAAAVHDVPRSTLGDKILGKTPLERKMGGTPYLTTDEGNKIVR